MTLKKYILTTLTLLFSSLLSAQDPYPYSHPELEWFSFETEHFIVHYHQGTERTAKLVAKIAEDIHGPVTQFYQYDSPEKLHFIIKDTDDYSNGGAFFFDNKIEIWAQNLDYVMRGTRNWLRDVVTHEYTHMISIQKMIKTSRTVPYGFFQVFGYEPERRKDVVRGFPNTVVSYPVSSINIPVWFAEGTAQYQAPPASYDYRDPHREMILRDRVLHNQLLTFEEMGVFGKTSHGNESAYNQGYAFVSWLCQEYGDQVLEKISDINSEPGTLTFDQALVSATGADGDSLYASWKNYLENTYASRLEKIIANEVKGKPVDVRGFSNLYPVWSPDGTKIAYISNKDNDYFSQNVLVVSDRQSGKRKEVSGPISSSISWSPDGKYLAYAKPTGQIWQGSTFNDLYLYDLEQEKEIRASSRLRIKNPDWNSDGSRLVFVAETNGLNQLMVMDIPEISDDYDKHKYLIDAETGRLLAEGETAKYMREVYVPGKLSQLLIFDDSRQIYHPRWSPDNSRIIFDTAVDYGRNIGQYDMATGTFSMLVEGPQEFRYPVYHPFDNAIYYAASGTGIYNLYRMDLDTRQVSMLTNVSGGAMMPAVNQKGDIVYSCYDSLGYHIYTIDQPQVLDSSNAEYQTGYLATLPVKNFSDSAYTDYEVKPYKEKFTGIHVLPRLMIDYGTIKPGLYVYANDVLDKMTLIGGGAVNFSGDYDLFGVFEFRKLGPTLFLEAYNMNAHHRHTGYSDIRDQFCHNRSGYQF